MGKKKKKEKRPRKMLRTSWTTETGLGADAEGVLLFWRGLRRPRYHRTCHHGGATAPQSPANQTQAKNDSVSTESRKQRRGPRGLDPARGRGRSVEARRRRPRVGAARTAGPRRTAQERCPHGRAFPGSRSGAPSPLSTSSRSMVGVVVLSLRHAGGGRWGAVRRRLHLPEGCRGERDGGAVRREERGQLRC